MKIFEDRPEIIYDRNIEGISSLKGMLLFDIETTGLKKETTQLYMIGCGFFDSAGEFVIRQWMTESALDEREVLEDFFRFSRDFDTLIHFNGDGFDIPYVAYKAFYYGLDFDFERFNNLDIYKKFKKAKKLLGLERANQKAVEAFLGISRKDEMDGGRLIPYYYDYERTGDPMAERLLLLHNHDDIKGLLEIIPAVYYGFLAEGRFRYKSCDEFEGTEILEYTLDFPLPRGFELSRGDILLCAEGELLQINLRIRDGSVKIPVPDRENYYYLPKEDMIVHKSVAGFVDKKFRVKASKENCFLKADVSVLPAQGAAFFENAASNIIAWLG